MFLQFLNEENAHQRFLSSFIYSLDPLSSSSLVYALANAPMRCVVTMVLNVSDSSDAWPGMLLHAHVNTFSNAAQSGPCTRAHVHMHLHKQVCPFKDAVHAYLSACTQRLCVCARVQSGVCPDETAAASCMQKETSCCLCKM